MTEGALSAATTYKKAPHFSGTHAERNKNMNDNETKQTAIINAATEQFRALLETNFASIAKAAQDGFVEDETQTEPKAKVAFSVEWDSLAQAPKVGVKISWSVRYNDESETEIDPLQSKLGLEANP